MDGKCKKIIRTNLRFLSGRDYIHTRLQNIFGASHPNAFSYLQTFKSKKTKKVK